MIVQALYLYPVKSCAPVKVDSFRCTEAGPEWDREWMIVDASGRFVTQRERPELARLQPARTGADDWRLEALGREPLALTGQPRAPERTVEIWGESVPGVDLGDQAARWLADVLGDGHRLVRLGQAGRRKAGDQPRSVRFVDSYPLHACTRASLADLAARAGRPLEIERFRPNLVLEGARAWEEDEWESLLIDGHRFRVGKRCERCTITTVDPATAQRGPEPLKTLAGFRRNEKNKVEFGQYLHSVAGAEIRVGMEAHAVIANLA